MHAFYNKSKPNEWYAQGDISTSKKININACVKKVPHLALT